jgi:hypothetical protein
MVDVGKRAGGEILFAQRGPILFGPFDGVPNWLRLGQQDKSIVGQHRTRCLQGAYWILRIAERLQEQDPIECATSKLRHRTQFREIALDELQVRRLGIKEVTTDIYTYRGGRTVSNKLSELGTVAATDIEHRTSGDITQKVSLRRPLHKPI